MDYFIDRKYALQETIALQIRQFVKNMYRKMAKYYH